MADTASLSLPVVISMILKHTTKYATFRDLCMYVTFYVCY